MEISKKYSVKLTNEFEAIKNERFILFGGGTGGFKCYTYLQEKGMDDRVECFIDSDPGKHGKFLCGKEIHSIDFLKDNPSHIVIVTTGLFRSVYECMHKANCRNKIFAYVAAIPPYADDDFAGDIPMIESFYDSNDEYSKIMIRSIVWLRDESNVRIQPIEDVISLNMEASYWYEGNSDLGMYDTLTIFDVGAFDGDTLRQFNEKYRRGIKKYHAFEPNELYLERLHNTVQVLNMEDVVEIHRVGLGDENTALKFFSPGHRISENGDNDVNVRRLDDMGLAVVGKPCMKMDVEGFEMKALAGAVQFIERHEPELAICVYHKANDIFRIPEFIKSINPEYQCILRGGLHMICYASTLPYRKSD